MDACARACVCVYAFMCTCNARSQMKNSKKKFVSAEERIQKSETLRKNTLRVKERESLGKRSRLDFNTRQSLILFYYKFVLLQTASASASANK